MIKRVMTMVVVFALLTAGSVQAAGGNKKIETRCGWFDNRTPGNASLLDRDGEWIISIQGGYEAEGEWPEFDDSQWVPTNGYHGHGCACLRVTVNKREHQIIRIYSAKARPLEACRKDRALTEPE